MSKEGFSKHYLGKPKEGGEVVVKREKILTPEEIEAEKVAGRKLEFLMRPDFDEFAVRFMNIDKILTLRSLPQ
jgi:hypothetical protein